MRGLNLRTIYIIDGVEFYLEKLPVKIYEDMLLHANAIELVKFREEVLQNDDNISGTIKIYYPEQTFIFVKD